MTTVPDWRMLRERSPRGLQARRRATALGASGLFVAGLLAAVGLASLVLVLLAGLAALAGLTAIVWALVRFRPWTYLRLDLRKRAAFLAGTSLVLVEKSASGLKTGTVIAARHTSRAADVVRPAAARRATLLWVGARRRAIDLRPAPATGDGPVDLPVDQHRLALELNARGTELRRHGAPTEATEQHLTALEIFRELGDRRAEALTLNNIALAVEQTGDEQGAVDHFEQALVILRDVSDEQREGQVIANLGFSMRRHGHDARARELLESALEKLDPASPAAQRIERQLRRAS